MWPYTSVVPGHLHWIAGLYLCDVQAHCHLPDPSWSRSNGPVNMHHNLRINSTYNLSLSGTHAESFRAQHARTHLQQLAPDRPAATSPSLPAHAPPCGAGCNKVGRWGRCTAWTCTCATSADVSVHSDSYWKATQVSGSIYNTLWSRQLCIR